MTISETPSKPEVESVKCQSCGFSEECTPPYIRRVRDRHQGRWICGLCAEAVKVEVFRSDRLISTEEALNRHISFCTDFRSSSSPPNCPISAMGRLLRRPLRSNSSVDLRSVGDAVRGSSLLRSGSCSSSLSR